jgi:hypothetical protein
LTARKLNTRPETLTFLSSLEGGGERASKAESPVKTPGLQLCDVELEGSVATLGKHQSHFFLRTVMKRYGWKIDARVFDRIDETDTVEIYGTDFSLKCANIRFLQLCSYTLEEVLSYPFHELYERDQLVIKKYIEAGTEIFAGRSDLVTDLGPDHLMTEIFSSRKKSFWIKTKFLAPVRGSDDSIVGCLYSAAVDDLSEPFVS